ncbi:MAG: type II toxin-antitoxin system HicB family antitoxin [Candidatus Diapherotrites archaeon]|nr:type II toxin-antitoxin system HicB family antitoxin [Candidatus Diapherotrites archaeon]
MNWKVVLEKDEESGLLTVTVPALPGCISQGKTRKEAFKNIKEAIELHLESLAQDGIPIRPHQEIASVAVKV